MGHDSQHLLLLAAGLIGLASADIIPSCWVCENVFVNKAVLTRIQAGCVTTAVEANPACIYSYGVGIQATSCYCGPDQGGYLTNAACCANERCAATDFSIGHAIGRSVCASSVLPPQLIPHLLIILQSRTTPPNRWVHRVRHLYNSLLYRNSGRWPYHGSCFGWLFYFSTGI